MKKVIKKKNKKKSIRVGKYVFPTQIIAEEFIDKQSGSDNLFARLGLRNSGFLVDVLWHDESEDWLQFEVNIKGEGCHQFKGFKYANS
tara:strand:+ start:168 stop:431 length:264 start_codon:yes stop_codon:yes gene_type:complete